MFFSLAAVAVGEHFYWTVASFPVNGQVLLVTWLVISIILTVAILGTRNMNHTIIPFTSFSLNLDIEII